MPTYMEKRKDIFALEGEWRTSLTKADTVNAALVFLEQIAGVQFIFRKVATEQDLHYYLDKATQKSYQNYRIIYLSFHGDPGILYLHGRRNRVTLESLGERFPLAFKDKIVHFGTCKTLEMDAHELKAFKKATGAALVSGYTSDVDFIDSTLLDIAYFAWLQRRERISTLDKVLAKHYPGMYERLGFKMVK